MTNFFSTLPQPIIENLTAANIIAPTPVQDRSFTPVREGRDLLAQSYTGSGKTLAFALPVALRLSEEASPEGKRFPRMLVLAPTRELAEQITTVFYTLLAPLKLAVANVTGGGSYGDQIGRLKRGVDVVVGTPGRMVDLLERGVLDLSFVQTFVLDEVDQMLDFGFADSLAAISRALPTERQTLFFSATLEAKVKRVAQNLLRNPVEVYVNKETEFKPAIEHSYVEIAHGKNLQALVQLLSYHTPSQAIIFCHTKQECADVFKAMLEKGFSIGMLNGDMKQAERTRTLNALRDKKLNLLVATDVAARGIDIPELSHVIHFSAPDRIDSYTHRSGRTGRAGAEGKAWTIVSPNHAGRYRRLCKELRIKANPIALPSLEQVVEKNLKEIEAQFTETKTQKAFYHKMIDAYLETLSPEAMKTCLFHVIDARLAHKVVGLSGKDRIAPQGSFMNGSSGSSGEKRKFRGGEGKRWGSGRGHFDRHAKRGKEERQGNQGGHKPPKKRKLFD